MSDLATLGLRIESQEADVAEKRLNDLSAAAAKTERATDALAGGSIRADGAIGKMLASIERGVRDLVAMGQAQMILAQSSQQAATATNSLATATERMKGQAAGAGAAVKQLDAHMDAYRASLASTAAATAVANDNLGRVNATLGKSKNSAAQMTQATLNMGRQFADIGVTAAMGMNPLMIMIQQGPQIAEAMDQASAAAGGLGNAVKGMAASFAPFLAVLVPVLAVVGAVAAGFALFHRELSKDYPKNITDGLNLTDEQLKKVLSTTVTFGDTVSATFKVVGERIMNGPIGEGLDWLGGKFTEVMNFVSNVVFEAVARIYGVFVGTYQTIIETWRTFPAVLGDLAITAINNLIRAFNQLPVRVVRIANQVISFFAAAWNAIQAGAAALPQIIPALFSRAFRAAVDVARSAVSAIANAIKTMSAAALDAFRGTSEAVPGIIQQMGTAARAALSGAPLLTSGQLIAELDNPFAGAGQQLADTLITNIAERTEAARGAMRSIGSDIASEALEGARRRALSEAGEAADEAGGAAARQRQKRDVDEIQRLWAGVNQEVRALNIQVPEILDPLDLAVRQLSQIDDLVRSAGSGMEESFGRAGKALAGLAESLSGYRLQMAEIAKAEASGKLWGTEAILERGRVEAQTYGDMASAAKSFFGEKTVAYKALQGVEMAYRALQFANAVRAMALDTTETGSSIANSLARGAAKAAEAVAGIFAKLGPFGFPVAAAALAVMASVGLKALGGGGGGSVPTLPTTNTGTGTVLGNSGDQSQSIERSLSMAERYQNRDLEYSSRMVTALRAIQANIGNLTTAIAREMQIGGGLDTTGLNQGPTTSGGFLGAFSTTRSSSLVGQGINLNSGNLAALISQGVSGGLYQIVQTTSTNSGFFGIGASTRTRNNETSTPIDQRLSQEFSRVLASLRDGVLAAAGDLGLTGAEAVLASFQVNLGRISFEGMSSSEISETLSAVFSAVGDDMARAILPGLDAFQRAGEGLFETLSRLATEYRTVDTTLASIGMTFGAVGLASLEARSRLVELSGGLDAFIEGADFFAQNFLTDAQRIAPVQAAVTAELERLGVATNITRSQFADLVLGLDVGSAAGAALYAALMRLAPALDQTLTYTEDLTGAVVDAADLTRQRRSLEIALMEATGDATGALAARRQDELDALDASLVPLQQAVWAALDLAAANEVLAQAQRDAAAAAEEAARRAAELASQRADLEIQLLEAQGNSVEALARRRQIELDAIDASLRPLQMALFAQLDLNAANEAAAAAAERAAEAQRQSVDAYNDAVGRGAEAAQKAADEQAQALKATQDRFAGFAKSLAEFRKSLDLDDGLKGPSYGATRSEFQRVASLAALGNEEALGSLQGVSEQYLAVSKDYSTTALGYLSDLSAVKIAVQRAEETAMRTVTNADLQLNALNAGLGALYTLNQSMLLVRDAVSGRYSTATGGSAATADALANAENLRVTGLWHDTVNAALRDGQPIPDYEQWRSALQTSTTPVALTMPSVGGTPKSMRPEVSPLSGAAVIGKLEDLEAALIQVAVNSGMMAKIAVRQDQDGVYVRGPDPDAPIITEAA